MLLAVALKRQIDFDNRQAGSNQKCVLPVSPSLVALASFSAFLAFFLASAFSLAALAAASSSAFFLPILALLTRYLTSRSRVMPFMAMVLAVTDGISCFGSSAIVFSESWIHLLVSFNSLPRATG